MSPFLYLEGVQQLAKEVRGDERIHIGIRPYGFHAGNALALLTYPYLLCYYTRLAGKEPNFTFFISLNDYEQDSLAGPDPSRYPFNIHPMETTIQHLRDEFGCCASMVDHWEPRIKHECLTLLMEYPGIHLQFWRNSSLKTHHHFREFFRLTIEQPKQLADIFKRYSGKEVLAHPMSYGCLVCPQCKRTQGSTVFRDDTIVWKCSLCSARAQGDFSAFDYWWYHKPLLLARLIIFNIDITISGGDHYSEGDFAIRRELIRCYAPDYKEPRMLFAPLLIAPDGRKMSKSRANTARVDSATLLNLALSSYADSLQVNESMVIQDYGEVMT